MIIVCEHCDKKFEIEPDLIPKNGRLLQCSSCGHKWFFKRNINEETTVVIKNQKNKKNETKPAINENNNIEVFNNLESKNKIKRKHTYGNSKIETISSLNFILVFIISTIALIVLLDTFKSSASLIIPNIEFILESLYETLKDILLFIQDLL